MTIQLLCPPLCFLLKAWANAVQTCLGPSSRVRDAGGTFDRARRAKGSVRWISLKSIVMSCAHKTATRVGANLHPVMAEDSADRPWFLRDCQYKRPTTMARTNESAVGIHTRDSRKVYGSHSAAGSFSDRLYLPSRHLQLAFLETPSPLLPTDLSKDVTECDAAFFSVCGFSASLSLGNAGGA